MPIPNELKNFISYVAEEIYSTILNCSHQKTEGFGKLEVIMVSASTIMKSIEDRNDIDSVTKKFVSGLFDVLLVEIITRLASTQPGEEEKALEGCLDTAINKMTTTLDGIFDSLTDKEKERICNQSLPFQVPNIGEEIEEDGQIIEPIDTIPIMPFSIGLKPLNYPEA